MKSHAVENSNRIKAKGGTLKQPDEWKVLKAEVRPIAEVATGVKRQ